MTDDLLDGTSLLEVLEGLAGDGTVDFQAIDEDSDRDQAVGLDILLEALVGLLVENDGVLCLVLDCSRVSALCSVQCLCHVRCIAMIYRRRVLSCADEWSW